MPERLPDGGGMKNRAHQSANGRLTDAELAEVYAEERYAARTAGRPDLAEASPGGQDRAREPEEGTR